VTTCRWDSAHCSLIIKTTLSIHFTTVHANLIEQTTSSIKLVVLKCRIIVVIRKDSRSLFLHRLEQHRCILLSKETYRTLVQPADPCGNNFWDMIIVSKILNPTSRWIWVFLERTRILSGIQFTTHFIEFFVAETKRFVGSFVHVILTRQTCGLRSSKAAESKRRSRGYYFSERICYTFWISKCRGEWDLGPCKTSWLAFEEPQFNGKIRFFLRRNTFFFWKLPLRCSSPNASPEVVHRGRSHSPLHFDIQNI